MLAELNRKAGWLIPSLVLSLVLLLAATGLSLVTEAQYSLSFQFLKNGLLLALSLGAVWAGTETYRGWREHGRSPRETWRGRIDLGRIGSFFVGGLLALFCINNYGAVKSQLGLLVPYSADPWLAEVDWLLMGGMDAWARLSFASHEMLPKLYHTGWGLWLVIVMAVLLLARPTKRRDALVTTFFALWVAGPLVHLLMPAVGPILYADIGLGDRFADLPLAPESVMTRDYLWQGYIERKIIPAGGISAMPSLHMATAAWAVLVFRRSPMLWPAIAIWFYLLIGSVLTGWHYVVDGIVGAAMAVACYALVRRLLFAEKTPAPLGVAQPATA